MPSDRGPSLKRARVEPDADADTTPDSDSDVQKDDQVWFSDGNIIVVAANKIAFRVHKSILSLRSEVFSDLFSLAYAEAATAETMDGCPVVHFSDSSEDIHHLFLVLCCGKNYYYNSDTLIPVPFAILASLIRMAHKYAVQDVLDDALSRLKKFYTKDLAAWQDPDSRAQYVTAIDQDAPTVVHLARLTNTPALLPPAFLICTQLATQCPLQPDGSRLSSIAALSPRDQAVVISAKALLVQARATRAFHLLGAVPAADCTTHETCEAARQAPLVELTGYMYLFTSSMSDAHALTPMADIFWARLSDWRRFCGRCKDALVKEDGMVIRLLWFHLPEVFALPPTDWDSWRGGSMAGRWVNFGGEGPLAS